MKCRKKKAPRLGRELFYNTLSLFADLVAYRAGRFASRLTRSWAFAAAAAAQGRFSSISLLTVLILFAIVHPPDFKLNFILSVFKALCKGLYKTPQERCF